MNKMYIKEIYNSQGMYIPITNRAVMVQAGWMIRDNNDVFHTITNPIIIRNIRVWNDVTQSWEVHQEIREV